MKLAEEARKKEEPSPIDEVTIPKELAKKRYAALTKELEASNDLRTELGLIDFATMTGELKLSPEQKLRKRLLALTLKRRTTLVEKGVEPLKPPKPIRPGEEISLNALLTHLQEVTSKLPGETIKLTDEEKNVLKKEPELLKTLGVAEPTTANLLEEILPATEPIPPSAPVPLIAPVQAIEKNPLLDAKAKQLLRELNRTPELRARVLQTLGKLPKDNADLRVYVKNVRQMVTQEAQALLKNLARDPELRKKVINRLGSIPKDQAYQPRYIQNARELIRLETAKSPDYKLAAAAGKAFVEAENLRKELKIEQPLVIPTPPPATAPAAVKKKWLNSVREQVAELQFAKKLRGMHPLDQLVEKVKHAVHKTGVPKVPKDFLKREERKIRSLDTTGLADYIEDYNRYLGVATGQQAELKNLAKALREGRVNLETAKNITVKLKQDELHGNLLGYKELRKVRSQLHTLEKVANRLLQEEKMSKPQAQAALNQIKHTIEKIDSTDYKSLQYWRKNVVLSELGKIRSQIKQLKTSEPSAYEKITKTLSKLVPTTPKITVRKKQLPTTIVSQVERSEETTPPVNPPFQL